MKMRITPACAGKRLVTHCRRHRDRDHPRMCGEKPALWLFCALLWGSPPHVRGKD